jgi:hypothetical protein
MRLGSDYYPRTEPVAETAGYDSAYPAHQHEQGIGTGGSCPGPAEISQHRLQEDPEAALRPIREHHYEEGGGQYNIAVIDSRRFDC